MGKGGFLAYIVENTTFFPSPFDGEGGRPQAGRVRIQAPKSPAPVFHRVPLRFNKEDKRTPLISLKNPPEGQIDS